MEKNIRLDGTVKRLTNSTHLHHQLLEQKGEGEEEYVEGSKAVR